MGCRTLMTVVNNASWKKAQSGSVHGCKEMQRQGQKDTGRSTLDVLQAATCGSLEDCQLRRKKTQEELDKGRKEGVHSMASTKEEDGKTMHETAKTRDGERKGRIVQPLPNEKPLTKWLRGLVSGSNSAVECQLPKLDVAGSIPVSRSIFSIT